MPHPDFPMNFQFIVEFTNRVYAQDRDFTSVSGLSASLESKLAPKNIFRPNAARKKILRPTFHPLVLKRAYRPDSKLLEWIMKTLNHHEREKESLTVRLMNTEHEMICEWRITDALPIDYHLSELNASNPEVLTETITLKYKYFEAVNSRGVVVAPVKP